MKKGKYIDYNILLACRSQKRNIATMNAPVPAETADQASSRKMVTTAQTKYRRFTIINLLQKDHYFMQ